MNPVLSVIEINMIKNTIERDSRRLFRLYYKLLSNHKATSTDWFYNLSLAVL